MEEPSNKPAALTPQGLDKAASYAWKLLVIAAALVAVIWLFVQLRPLVIAVIFSLFLTAVLAPGAARLAAKTPLGKGLASALTLIAFLIGVGLVGMVVIPPFGEQVTDLSSSLEQAVDDGENWLIEGPFELSQNQVNNYVEQAGDQLQSNSSGIVSGVLGGALLVLEIVGAVLIGLVATFFLMRDGSQVWSWVVSLFSPRVRDDLDEVGGRCWEVVGGYLRGVAVVATVDAVLIGIALAILGVPAALPLAVLTFFGAFIPFVGAIVVGGLAAIVALVSNGVEVALIVVVVIIAIQQLEGDLLYPLVVGKTVQLHPLVTLLVIVAGGALAGIIGAVIAIPISAAIGQMLAFSRERRGEAPAANT